MQAAGYEVIDHTADVGVRAWAPEPGRAFAEAALGMFAVMLGEDPARWHGSGATQQLRLEVEGRDWDDLLVNWLGELLYRFEAEGFVPRAIELERCVPPRCAARLVGLHLQNPQEAAGVVVKAVTYHQLSVQVAPGRTDIHVLLDI